MDTVQTIVQTENPNIMCPTLQKGKPHRTTFLFGLRSLVALKVGRLRCQICAAELLSHAHWQENVSADPEPLAVRRIRFQLAMYKGVDRKNTRDLIHLETGKIRKNDQEL
jgi:hypothetical protein